MTMFSVTSVVDKTNRFAAAPVPTDPYGNDLPTADFSPADAAWKAQEDAQEPLPRFYVEELGPMKVGPGQALPRSLPFAVIDRNGEAIIGHYRTRREAEQVARWENEQAELDADAEYQAWLSQVGDSLPPRQYRGLGPARDALRPVLTR
jgi:hypothetical protein